MKLKSWLTKFNLTQRQAAELIAQQGVACDQSMVSRYCSGDRTPTFNVMRAIERATQNRVTAADFMLTGVEVRRQKTRWRQGSKA